MEIYDAYQGLTARPTTHVVARKNGKARKISYLSCELAGRGSEPKNLMKAICSKRYMEGQIVAKALDGQRYPCPA